VNFAGPEIMGVELTSCITRLGRTCRWKRTRRRLGQNQLADQCLRHCDCAEFAWHSTELGLHRISEKDRSPSWGREGASTRVSSHQDATGEAEIVYTTRSRACFPAASVLRSAFCFSPV